ncbi:MAG: hypothetical protein IPJ34_07960 [Myxococcales bacterium]|nr:hypothetical protein [Myxococcales bacterium]
MTRAWCRRLCFAALLVWPGTVDATPPTSSHRVEALYSAGIYGPYIENDGFATPIYSGVTQGLVLGYGYGFEWLDLGVTLQLDALLSHPHALLTTPSLYARVHGSDQTGPFAELGLALHRVDNSIKGADPHTGELLTVHYSSHQPAAWLSGGGTFAVGRATQLVAKLCLFYAGEGDSDQSRPAVTRRGTPLMTFALFLQVGLQFEL